MTRRTRATRGRGPGDARQFARAGVAVRQAGGLRAVVVLDGRADLEQRDVVVDLELVVVGVRNDAGDLVSSHGAFRIRVLEVAA